MHRKTGKKSFHFHLKNFMQVHKTQRRDVIETPGKNLRCLDAHSHLGNFVFDYCSQKAIEHNEENSDERKHTPLRIMDQ